MRGRKESCRKRCVGVYCRQHNYQLKKGMKMPAPCRGCGAGVLCDYRLCIPCGGIALKQRLIRKRKKSKDNFSTCFARDLVNTIREMKPSVITQVTMASVHQRFEERLEEELAKIDPATLQYLEQLLAENAPAVRKVVQNVLNEPISQETQKSLQKPLIPNPFQPRPPPRQRKSRKKQELLREYDTFPAQNIRTVTDYQNEILDLFDDATHEEEESKGRRFIR